jgi:error-prone DNA polymerase
MSYIELHSRTAFSFLRGGSYPEELAVVAASKQLPALAVCDRDGVYGSAIFKKSADEKGVRAVVGAEVTLEDESVLPVLVQSRKGYQNLCQLLTRAHLRAEKGKPRVQWNELPEFAEGLVALTGDEEGPLIRAITNAFGSSRGHETLIKSESPYVDCYEVLENLTRAFGRENVFIEIQRHRLRGEERLNNALVDLARAERLPLLATNGVLYAQPAGRQVLDVFTCLRHHTHLDAAGLLLAANSERHLKSADEMRVLFHDLPEAIDNTLRLAERLEFSLENLGYEFPAYAVPPGHSMDSFLRDRAFTGARTRYDEVPEKVRQQLEKELALIAKLGVAGYFLIVWDIAEFCRAQNIMSQGRGSAANSTVCFCLGITNVDPLKFHTLFERFLSEGRKKCWPDIDIDLPSGDRRERVIQEVYRRYGKCGAAMTANVITYRGRSSAREIGKVLNIGPDVLDRFSAFFANGDFPHTMDLLSQMKESGLPTEHPRARAFAALYQQMQGLPRHLGQHSGGMVICEGKLDSVVPLENASMSGRVVAQWDKDSCEDMGIIKVDLLGLGMMSVLQDAVELCRENGRPIDLAHLPEDDPDTFKMICDADTIGVFQIESRAQMATLPRMKPENFYDLVIEVAIIRPGPIQGNLTHPYLKRRAGREDVTYYDKSLEPILKPILERTKGVPLFQEQMLEMAMYLADFTGSEAEELRRALSFHRSDKEMNKVSKKLRAALERKGNKPHVVESVLNAITSFALYGFPESHAISFAHMAYSSAYMKVHRPAEFYASLLNNQPMGFYSSATLIKDAQRRGVHFKPVCVMRSEWDCTIESSADFQSVVSPMCDPLIDETSSALEWRDAPASLSPQRGEGLRVRGGTAEGLWISQETSARTFIRLGLRVVRGLSETSGRRILAERQGVPFTSLEDFKRRVRLNKDELRTLAEIGALNCFAAHRRDAMWDAEREIRVEDLFGTAEINAGERVGKGESETISSAHSHSRTCSLSPLPAMNAFERLRADFTGTHLTIGRHPMALIRPQLKDVWRAADLPKAKHGDRLRIAGNVICRQRPGTAKGFVFISLEDETGISNAIVRPDLFEELRLMITEESFLVIEGEFQNVDNVMHVRAEKIERLKQEQLVGSTSYDFH